MRTVVTGLVVLVLCTGVADWARAVDKNGVSPQVVSLPSGPGSISGLGESYQPQLNTGGGSFSVPIRIPSGTAGHAPVLALHYNPGNGNGFVGAGWGLSGFSSVDRNIDEGLPRYIDGPNGYDDDGDGHVDNVEELDRFTGVDQEELVPVSGNFFRAETERGFVRYARMGAGWEARTKSGVRHEFGLQPASQISDSGRVYRWLLERSVDTNGNVIQYNYRTEPGSPGEKYPSSVRWGRGGAFYDIAFSYAVRPDVFSDFRSTFEVRTALRLVRIDVIAQGVPPSQHALTGDFNGDGVQDALIRRYLLNYDDGGTLSLLRRVTQVGSDGVTALPPTTFTYTTWTPPDSVSGYFIATEDVPTGVGLNSDSVELVDMNADALPDLLSTFGGNHTVYLNQGEFDGILAWNPAGLLVTGAQGFDLASPRIHLADANADGLADLVFKTSTGAFGYFGNTGDLEWQQPRFVGAKDSAPLWPFEDGGAAGRTLDLDHNRRSDILHTNDNVFRIWQRLPWDIYSAEMQIAPLVVDSTAFRFDMVGAHVADLNGDRLEDLALVQSSRVVYWPSQGYGQFGEAEELYLGAALDFDDIQKSGFADVNGDGVVDLTLVRPESNQLGIDYWLNLGRAGLDSRRSIEGLPAIRAGDALRWADMNANGSVDILISNSTAPTGDRFTIIDLVPGVRPNLLARIDNGLGLNVQLEYQTSAAQMIEAESMANPWQSTMPISVPVVSHIVESDGRGHAYERRFRYRDPYFDAPKQEFRGFAQAEVIEPGDESTPARVTRHWFDTGIESDCLKGVELRREVSDGDGALFTRTETVWDHRTLLESANGIDASVCFASRTSEDSYVYEGTPNPVHLRAEYIYGDPFGNLTEQRNLGIVDESGPGAGDDEIITRFRHIHDTARWMVDRKCSEEVLDLAGTPHARGRFYYDGATDTCPATLPVGRGNLTRQESWLDTENRYIPTLRSDYDPYGNVIRITDANGHQRSIDYDGLLHIYPVGETVHLADYNLVTTAAYDFGFGTVVQGIDFAGTTSAFDYDTLGRLIRALRPGGAESLFEYHLGAPVSHVRTRVKEDASGGYFETHAYFDGLGRGLQKKIEAEHGQWRMLNAVDFNDRKQAVRQWLPYYSTTPAFEMPESTKPYAHIRYDTLDRAIQVTNPDNTSTRAEFEPLVVYAWDENDNAGAATPKTQRSDGRGRLVEVLDRNGPAEYITTFQWNTLGDMTRVTDANHNVKTYGFDSLRRKIRMDDPDRGAMTYRYDDVGNLLETVDAKNQTIRYAYDFANRLLTENYLDQPCSPGDLLCIDPIDVFYTYDQPSEEIDFGDTTRGTATFTGGRLASVRDLSGEEHFSYDVRGNTLWTVKRIKDPLLGLSSPVPILVPYKTEFAYDLMDRVTDLIYPDNDHARYVYNEASFVERIDGGIGGVVILSNVDYEPTGQMARMDFGNGVITTHEFDDRDRLSRMKTDSPVAGQLIHYTYDYDPVSNITRIVDHRPFELVPQFSPRRNSQLFAYDDLYRLTQVRYQDAEDDSPVNVQIDYRFDPIGNMTYQSSPPAGEPGHIPDPNVNHGVMTSGGSLGSVNRTGKLPGDPPGPCALTATEAGGAFAYDNNGNMTNLDGADLTWDFKNRLVRFQQGIVDAHYTYNFADRRATKLVTDRRGTDQTLYINSYFEYRPNRAPLKYVLSGGTRLAQVQGTLDPHRDRTQRIWLLPGWNLISLAVADRRPLNAIFAQDAQVRAWTGTQYVPQGLDDFSVPGRPLWVLVQYASVVTAVGAYPPTHAPPTIPCCGRLFAWPRLEPLVPVIHLDSSARLRAQDYAGGPWLTIDAALPSYVTDLIDAVPAASAFWSGSASPFEAIWIHGDAQFLFSHADHLGSASLMTDSSGRLYRETHFYPFGAPRTQHVADPQVPHFDAYLYTGMERDSESTLSYHSARYLGSSVGRWTTPDPAGDIDALNPYQYAHNNPERYVDLSGMQSTGKADPSFPMGKIIGSGLTITAPLPDKLLAIFEAQEFGDGGPPVRFSDKAAKIPELKVAVNAVWNNLEGRRAMLSAAIDGDIDIGYGRLSPENIKLGAFAETDTETGDITVWSKAIARIKKLYPDSTPEFELKREIELAFVVYHEIRHLEGAASGDDGIHNRLDFDEKGNRLTHSAMTLLTEPWNARDEGLANFIWQWRHSGPTPTR